MDKEKTLLVIEDEPAILRFLRPSMENMGWRVVEATTGRAGLDLASSKKPAVFRRKSSKKAFERRERTLRPAAIESGLPDKVPA